MSDSGYTPSTEEVAKRFQMSSRNEFGHRDPKHKTDLEFSRWLEVIREDERKRLADEFAKHSMSICEETMPVNDRYVTTEAWLRGQSFTGTEEQK